MNIKVLTHIDFDGIFSGSILFVEIKRLFNTNPDIILGMPKNLDKPLQEISSSLSKIDKLYIADLSLNDNLIDTIEPFLKSLKGAGTEIYWYDHHQWTKKALYTAEKYCSDFKVMTKYKTAAELMVVETELNSEYSKKLVRTIKNRYSDDEEKEWGNTWKYFLSSLSADSIDFVSIENAIIKLAKNQEFNFFDIKKIEKMKKQEELTQKFIEKEHRIETTFDNHKFVVVDMRDAKNVSQMAPRQVAAHHKVDFYIAVLDNNRLQVGNSYGKNLNFKPLHSVKKIEKYTNFNIKGHSYVAAVYFTPGFFSIIKNIFSKKFVDEIEAFIRFIKEKY